MLSSFERILRSVTTLVLCAMVVAGCWGMYRVYSAAMDRIKAVSEWISKVEDIVGKHSKRLKEIESTSDRMKSIIDRYKSGSMNTIDNNIEPISPTVRMYGSESCGPCSDWWNNESDNWRQAGWIVEKYLDTSGKPIPYWNVWDGSKWLTIKTRLSFETYKKAGGR